MCTVEHPTLDTFMKVYFCSLHVIAAATLPQSAELIFGTVQEAIYMTGGYICAAYIPLLQMHRREKQQLLQLYLIPDEFPRILMKD